MRTGKKMDFNSARGLKVEIRQRMVIALQAPEMAGAFDISARRIAGSLAPMSLALGMAAGDILTKRDVAEPLQASERTVERWMSEGSIPYVPLPKHGAWSESRFLQSEIVEWMRKRTVKPIRVPHGVVNAQSA